MTSPTIRTRPVDPAERQRRVCRYHHITGDQLAQLEAAYTTCPGCLRDVPLCVDRPASAANPRGMLCRACLMAVTYAHSDPGRLERLAGYLRDRGAGAL